MVVRPDTATLRVGDSRTLTVVATDALGNVAVNPAVAWSSSDTTRVRVSSTGVVTGRALGTATISATVSGITGTASVFVASALPASVRATRDRDTLNYLGATRQLTAYVYDGFGAQIPTLTPTWSALDPSLMTVTPAGVATEVVDGGALARAVATYGGAADTDGAGDQCSLQRRPGELGPFGGSDLLHALPGRTLQLDPDHLHLAPGVGSRGAPGLAGCHGSALVFPWVFRPGDGLPAVGLSRHRCRSCLPVAARQVYCQVVGLGAGQDVGPGGWEGFAGRVLVDAPRDVRQGVSQPVAQRHGCVQVRVVKTAG